MISRDTDASLWIRAAQPPLGLLLIAKHRDAHSPVPCIGGDQEGEFTLNKRMGNEGESSPSQDRRQLQRERVSIRRSKQEVAVSYIEQDPLHGAPSELRSDGLEAVPNRLRV
jgi:hypothetical protein